MLMCLHSLSSVWQYLSIQCLHQFTGTLHTLLYCSSALDDMTKDSVCQHDFFVCVWNGKMICNQWGKSVERLLDIAAPVHLPHPGTYRWQFTLQHCDHILCYACFLQFNTPQQLKLLFPTSEVAQKEECLDLLNQLCKIVLNLQCSHFAPSLVSWCCCLQLNF